MPILSLRGGGEPPAKREPDRASIKKKAAGGLLTPTFCANPTKGAKLTHPQIAQLKRRLELFLQTLPSSFTIVTP
jgi:hypothetical protein